MAMVVQLIREARKQSPSVVLSYSPGEGAPACYYPLRVSRNVEASGLSYWDCRSSTFPRRRRAPPLDFVVVAGRFSPPQIRLFNLIFANRARSPLLASTPFAGGSLSPKVAPKSPRSFEEADPRVTYKGVGVISKSKSTTVARRGREYSRVRTCMAKDLMCSLSGREWQGEETGTAGEKGRGRERNVLRESKILQECLRHYSPPRSVLFYGLNFLKDVQTTKLNAQLDVKERPSPCPSIPRWIYIDERAPDFSCALFRPNASLS